MLGLKMRGRVLCSIVKSVGVSSFSIKARFQPLESRRFSACRRIQSLGAYMTTIRKLNFGLHLKTRTGRETPIELVRMRIVG
jgi:hypothetical protein